MENLSMIYKGAHSDTLYSSFFDGSAWHGDTKIEDQPGNISPESNYNPGAAVLNNWLYIIYKGAHSNTLYSSWYDGKKWNGNKKISDQLGKISPESNYCPNAVVYKGALFIVYKGASSNELYSAWFDGTTWFGNKKISSQKGNISPESNYNPGMVVFDDKLYIIYKSANSDDLYTAYYQDGSWFGNTKIKDQPGGISPQSDNNPGVAVFNNRMYIVYKGANSDTLYTAFYDGTTWQGNQKISDQPGDISPESNYCPNAAVYNNRLYIVYKGAHSDNIYTAAFDGNSWSGNTKIADQAGDISPESNYTPSLSMSTVTPNNQSTWMEGIPDSVLLSEINIPGSHDAAAINTSTSTPYACHNQSISDQLFYGIRLLDVRIEVLKDGDSYTFMTCHSDTLSSTGLNTYQSLISLLDECRIFLSINSKEVIVMSVKIDDWHGTEGDENKMAAKESLADLLETYPIYYSENIPALGQVRGKIFLYSRISNLRVGVPLHIPDNTSGEYVKDDKKRSYPVYVQDKYKDLSLFFPEKEKLELVVKAFSKKKEEMVVWNFASATQKIIFGVYIMPGLLSFFGAQEASNRPQKFGWVLFDYPFNAYLTTTYQAMTIVSLIIDSNFEYSTYPEKFKVLYF